MISRRTSRFVVIGALALASCGGSDGPSPSDGLDAGASPDAEPSDITVADTEATNGEPSDGDSTATSTAAPLVALWSVPVNGRALGSTITMSPDGSQVAFMTGGIQPFIEIYDAATGDKVNSAEYHGQGLELFWTDDNQLVSWDDERLHLVDAASLSYPGAVEFTIAPGAEECPSGSFDVIFDRASGAMFVADFHDTGTIVCRVDIGTATISSTVIEGRVGPGKAMLRPETGELVVAYNVDSASGTDSVAVLDAATLAVKSSGPTSTGLPVLAATATDLVVGLDRATYGLASTGQPVAATPTGERFGPILLGSGLTGELIVMDQTSGAALFSGAQARVPADGTADGSKLALLLADSLEVYALG